MTKRWLEISPREAWLEQEYSRIKAEVEWLRQSKGMDAISYGISDEPRVMSISNTSQTLHLAMQAGMSADRTGRLHVYVKETTGPDAVGMRYFCSLMESRTERDRAAMMADMHERLVLDIGRHLWSGK